jgi:hypothetical protein
MVEAVSAVFAFLIGLAVSTVIIYLIAKLFGEKEGVGSALIAALIGAVIYSVSYFFIGQGIIAAIIAGIVWLFALKGVYSIGWTKSLVIAAAVWVAALVVGLLLPTVPGPL